MIDKRAKVLFNANQKDGKLEAKIEHVANTKIKVTGRCYCMIITMQRLDQIMIV